MWGGKSKKRYESIINKLLLFFAQSEILSQCQRDTDSGWEIYRRVQSHMKLFSKVENAKNIKSMIENS